MNQLVYVHGVDGPRTNDPADETYLAYQDAAKARDLKFRQVTFDGQVTITNALWSIYAAHPAWNLACVPRLALKTEQGVVALGIRELIGEDPAVPAFQPGGDSLARAAKRDLDAVVGSLSSIAIEEAQGSDAASLKAAEDFWTAAAKALEDPAVRTNLITATDDMTFLDRLQGAAQTNLPDLSLSVGDTLRNAAAKLTGATIDLVNSPAVLAVRNKLTPELAIFIGDVFTYLKQGTARDNIRSEIQTRLLEAARTATQQAGQLIAVGHSMGGVILYDLLSDASVVQRLTQDLGKPFKVDLLLTVGSQVALFEEIKVFTASSAAFSAAANNKMKKPDSAERWWNVFNRLDVLSFLAEPVFNDVEDLEASTTAGITDAHSAYFTNLVFYTRLNDRLRKAGLLS